MMLHPNFKLNDQSYNEDSLLEFSKELVNQSLPYNIAVGAFLIDWLNSEETLKVQTSGSTGTPKQILLKKEHMVNSALATGSYFGLKPKDTALLCLSADFIAGKMMLVRAMVLGLEIDIVAPKANPLEGTDKHYDFCAMVPMQVDSSIDCSNQLNTVIIGGAPVSGTLRAKLQGVQANCFETYGMTETITHIAVKKINGFRPEHDEPYFGTLPNISISKDKRGCLVINAPKISDNTIVTNDIVELIDNKSFKWLGRYDNIINSGGVKLITEQIEKKLSTVIKNRFFVAGISDELLGQKLVLVLEGNQNINSIKALINSLDLLSKYEIPKEVFVISEFDETNTGKLNRSETLKLLNG